MERDHRTARRYTRAQFEPASMFRADTVVDVLSDESIPSSPADHNQRDLNQHRATYTLITSGAREPRAVRVGNRQLFPLP